MFLNHSPFRDRFEKQPHADAASFQWLQSVVLAYISCIHFKVVFGLHLSFMETSHYCRLKSARPLHDTTASYPAPLIWLVFPLLSLKMIHLQQF